VIALGLVMYPAGTFPEKEGGVSGGGVKNRRVLECLEDGAEGSACCYEMGLAVS
jgi:hypothetical protein